VGMGGGGLVGGAGEGEVGGDFFVGCWGEDW